MPTTQSFQATIAEVWLLTRTGELCSWRKTATTSSSSLFMLLNHSAPDELAHRMTLPPLSALTAAPSLSEGHSPRFHSSTDALAPPLFTSSFPHTGILRAQSDVRPVSYNKDIYEHSPNIDGDFWFNSSLGTADHRLRSASTGTDSSTFPTTPTTANEFRRIALSTASEEIRFSNTIATSPACDPKDHSPVVVSTDCEKPLLGLQPVDSYQPILALDYSPARRSQAKTPNESCSHSTSAETPARYPKSGQITLEPQALSSKPWLCITCNQSFARKYDMMRHTRRHTGEKVSLIYGLARIHLTNLFG